jgi:hypothetical protein
MLRGGLVKTSDIAIASGGFGDVWKGAYKGRRVAIKSLRVCMTDDLDYIKRVRANVQVCLIRIDLVLRAGYFRNFAKRWSCGKDCRIRMLCPSLEYRRICLRSVWYPSGCPRDTLGDMCSQIQKQIVSSW